MILIDNINFLRENYREIRESLTILENTIDNEPIKIIEAKNGSATLQVMIDGSPKLVHSKYDPEMEAEKFVEQFVDKIFDYQHVLFYGIGLGYHIDAFVKKYSHISITLYEPNETVFYHYVCNKNMKNLPVAKMKNLFVEKSENDMKRFLNEFSNETHGRVLLVCLPSYEQIFSKQYKSFFTTFKEVIKGTRTGLQTNLSFEQRWTINSMMNFPETMRTPNILHDINRENFIGKPVLLVSAGPSLSDEIENIKRIKEKGLAYIFSVGTAINALIEYGVYPDGAFTYDPKQRNQFVFQKVVERGIDTIPLIYGTSVGFETIQKYPGPKIHMVTSQDTVTPYYVNNIYENSGLQYVNDAPSIAVVTLEVLYKLGFNLIILVGQNLAFKGKQKFSKGIDYTHISTSLSEEQLKSAMKVESVDGQEVLTDPSYNRMRIQIEGYILAFKDVKVINTTKGGAKIKGTTFESLDRVMEEVLSDQVVNQNWFKADKKFYRDQIIQEKRKIMDDQLADFQFSLERLSKLLIKMEGQLGKKQERELNRQFDKIDREFKNFKKNMFYKVFIAPMLRVQFDLAAKNIKSIRFEKDTILKGRTVLNTLGGFIYDCKKTLVSIYPLYVHINKEIEAEKLKTKK